MKLIKFVNLFEISLFLSLPILAAASDLDSLDNNIPVVLTPTRLQQSLADVPAAVTTISSETLQQFGITSIPEALRLVPGMAVAQVSGNDYRINYHGTNILVPRRMDVLIDGMSVYSPAISSVDWKNLPVSIEDVDHIEVTRGPDSASYGPNAMLAVINIITKHPDAVQGTTLLASAGSRSTAEGMARYAGKIGDATSYRITIDRQKDNGFSYSSIAHDDHDSTRTNRLNFQSATNISNNETLNLQAYIVQSIDEIPYVDKYQSKFPDADVGEYYLNMIWKKNLSPTHDIQIQTYVSDHTNEQNWTDCPPAAFLLPQLAALWKANPTYVNTIIAGHMPSGGSAADNALAATAIAAIRDLGAGATHQVCATTNQNYTERRLDVEFQDTLVFSKSLRMVNGFGMRQDMGDSQTYLDGRITNNSYREFSNIEYRPLSTLNLNVGGLFETDQITGSAFSPRAALNFHASDNDTFRFIVSKGNRMPSIFEQDGNQSYHGTLLSPQNGISQVGFFQSAQSPGNLTSEKILSREIGYFGNFPKYGLLVDAKIFDDSLTDLISQKLQVSSFLPNNNNWTELRGAEFQINYAPNDSWTAFVNYAYLHNDGTSTPLEQTQYATSSGSLGITHLLGNNLRAAFAVYGNGANTASQTFYGREDLTLSKMFDFGKNGRVLASFVARHFDNVKTTFYQDVGSTFESAYDRGMQYFVTMKCSY